jgi:hypothetical protein
MTEKRGLSVFLCHLSKDKPRIRDLYKRLSKEEGLLPWLDEENLLPGQDWDLEIKNVIRGIDVAVVCITNASITKEGYIQKEIKMVLDIMDEKPDGTIFIIPLRLEECVVPEKLKKYHYADFFGNKMNVERGYSKLLAAIDERKKIKGISSSFQYKIPLRETVEQMVRGFQKPSIKSLNVSKNDQAAHVQYSSTSKAILVEKLTNDVLVESRVRGRISGRSYNDLAYLGKQCEAGEEREMVVIAFKYLVKEMLTSPKYNGDSFESLIEDLVHILVATPEPKDLGNYDITIKILSAVLSANKAIGDDRQRAIHAISKLGRTLIIHFKSVERDNIILDYIDSLEFALTKKEMLTEVSQALFEIGVCAVKEDQDFMVVATLDKMTSLAENYSPLPDEFVADMLGILASFWAKGGSRRELSNLKLKEVGEFLPKDIMSSVANARNHCMKTMYFDVADQLDHMIIALKSEKKPRKKK